MADLKMSAWKESFPILFYCLILRHWFCSNFDKTQKTDLQTNFPKKCSGSFVDSWNISQSNFSQISIIRERIFYWKPFQPLLISPLLAWKKRKFIFVCQKIHKYFLCCSILILDPYGKSQTIFFPKIFFCVFHLQWKRKSFDWSLHRKLQIDE